MPLSIVLTFLSPTGPQQSLPCGTQNAGCRQSLTGGKHFDEIPNIPKEESLRHYCFPHISFHIEMQCVILHIENKLCKTLSKCILVIEGSSLSAMHGATVVKRTNSHEEIVLLQQQQIWSGS